MPDELLDHRARDRGREQRFAGGDDANGRGDLLRRRVFEHEAARAGAQRVVDVVVEPECRQDQDAGRGLVTGDAAGRLDPVEHGHANVHQHDVGPEPACLGDGVFAVDGLADDGRVRLVLEDLAQADADERLVVGDQYASSSDRQQDANGEAAARPPAGVEPAAVERDAFTHADEAVPAARRPLRRSRAVVGDLELERVRAVANVDASRALARVLERVRQRLLDDPVGG